MKQKKVASAVALTLCVSLAAQHFFIQDVFAFENTLYNAMSVPSEQQVGLSNSPMLAVGLPRNISDGSHFDLSLNGADWNLPSTRGTLQSLYGSQAFYESRVTDSRAVPYARTADLTPGSNDVNNGGIVNFSNNGDMVNFNDTGDTQNAVTLRHQMGLVGDIENGFELVQNNGFIVYNYTPVAGTAALQWRSTAPSIVSITGSDQAGFDLLLRRQGSGTAEIIGEAINAEGNPTEVVRFSVECIDLTSYPTVEFERVSDINYTQMFGGRGPLVWTDSDVHSATLKISTSNIVGGLTFVPSDPDLTVVQNGNLLTINKNPNLSVNKYVTVDVKMGNTTINTIIVRLMANKVATVSNIVINGDGFSRIGTSSLQASPVSGVNPILGSLTLHTDKGLSVGDRVDWFVSDSESLDLINFTNNSIVTAANQVTFTVGNLDFDASSATTYRVVGTVGNDKVLEFFIYATNQAKQLGLVVQRPASSVITNGTATNFILPKGESSGLLTVSSTTGTEPEDYVWTRSNNDAATVTVVGGNMTVNKSQYLSENIPLTVQARDPITNAIVYTFTILLEVEDEVAPAPADPTPTDPTPADPQEPDVQVPPIADDAEVSVAPAPGSGLTVGAETDFILPLGVSTARLNGTFEGVNPAMVDWASSHSDLVSVSKSGSDVVLIREQSPEQDTIITITANRLTFSTEPLATYSVLVKGTQSEERVISVDIPSGSSITWDAGFERHVLPSSAASGTLAISKPTSLDSSRITWTSSDPEFIIVSSNAASTMLTVRRIGNNGSARALTIRAFVDGSEVLAFPLFDEGGDNLDASGETTVALSRGNGMESRGDGFLIPSYNSFGLLNVHRTGFTADTSLRFTTSHPELVDLSLNTQRTSLRVTRTRATSEENTISLNIIVDGITIQTVPITLSASHLVGTVSPSFQVTPVTALSMENDVFVENGSNQSIEFDIDFSNTAANEVVWGTHSNRVELRTEGNKLFVDKIPGRTTSETLEIFATRGGTTIGSFRLRIRPFTVDIDREIAIAPETNFTVGQSVDFVMEADSAEGTFLIDYVNYSANEVSWAVDSDLVGVRVSGNILTIERKDVIPVMTGVTLTVSSVQGTLETYTLLIPATDEPVNLANMRFSNAGGVRFDETSGKYLVSGRSFVMQMINSGNIPLNANWESTNSQVTVIAPHDTANFTIAEGFTGEFTVNVTHDGYLPTTLTFVVDRLATSEIYIDLQSGANFNTSTGKWMMTDTTAVFQVTDYNYQHIGGLQVACSDPYVAVTVVDGEMRVVHADGYEREFSVLLTANGFDQQTLNFIPHVLIEPGIFLSNPEATSWLKTGAREWTLEEDGDNTEFVVRMNPTAVGRARVTQIDENGMSRTLPVTYANGGTSFLPIIPSHIPGSVTHTIRVVMNGQEREFDLVFEGSDEPTENETPPIIGSDAIGLAGLEGFVEVEPGTYMLRKGQTSGSFSIMFEGQILEGYDWTNVNTRARATVGFEQIAHSISMVAPNMNRERASFRVLDVLAEDYETQLTVNIGRTGESRTFTLIFQGEFGETDSEFFDITSFDGTISQDTMGIYYAEDGRTQLTLNLQSRNDTEFLMFSSDSQLISIPQMETFDINTGTMSIPIDIGLTTTDRVVTISMFAPNSTGRLVPAGSIKVNIPRNNTGSEIPEREITGALSNFHYEVINPQTLRITIPEGYQISNGDVLYIPMLVTSRSNDGATVQVLASNGGTYIKDSTHQFLLSARTGTTVEVAAVRNFHSSTTLADITISENGPLVLTEGELKFTISRGFSFDTSSDSAVRMNGVLYGALDAGGSYSVKDNVATINLSNLPDGQSKRQGQLGSITLTGLQIKRDKDTDDTGRITMRVEGAGVTRANVIVANAQAEAIDIQLFDEKDDVPVLRTGMYTEDSLDDVNATMEFVVSGELADARRLSLDMNDGVIIRALEVISVEGLEGVDRGDIIYSSGHEDYDRDHSISLKDNSIDLSKIEVLDSAEPIMTLKAFVTFSANFQDKELTILASTSDAEEVEPIVIAEVEQPITVNSTPLILPVISSNAVINLPDFELSETDRGSLDRQAPTVEDAFRDPRFVDTTFINSTLVIGVEGFEITELPTIEIERGDITLSAPTLVDGKVNINISRNSRTASNIVFKNVKGRPIVTEVPEQGFALQVGGTAMAGNFFDGRDRNVFDTFPDAYFAHQGYISKTEGDEATAAGHTARLTLDSPIITLDNGDIITMDVTPLIVNNRTMLPIRFVGNAIGISDENIVWIESTRSVFIFADGKIVQFQLGSNVITTTLPTGEVTILEMDVMPLIVNDRTLLPVRYVAEALSLKVEWVPETRTVIILSQTSDLSEVGVIPPALLDPTTHGLAPNVQMPPLGMAVPNQGSSTGQGSSVSEEAIISMILGLLGGSGTQVPLNVE